VASRGTIKLWIRNLLGTTTDDPSFPDAVLDPIVQQAADAIVADLFQANPDLYSSPGAPLLVDTAGGHGYTLVTQATSITDFGGVLELRYTDETGSELHEMPRDQLLDAGAGWYGILGLDEAAQIVTSPDTEAGTPLWLRYRVWPAEMQDDTDLPAGIPQRFHDVIALEALFAFGLGGEQRLPPELFHRWGDRRAQLVHHVTHRSLLPRRTRLVTQE